MFYASIFIKSVTEEVIYKQTRNSELRYENGIDRVEIDIWFAHGISERFIFLFKKQKKT